MVVESVVLIVAIILAVLVFLRFIPLNLWISALASGVHVSIFTLMGMRIRRVPPAKIVGPLIKAEKAGLNMQISKMEAHFLAGGNLDRVITALITARARTSSSIFRRPAPSTWQGATFCRRCR